ncbi:MAG: hypothetical protein QXI87_08015 [Thermoproteota archaeon]
MAEHWCKLCGKAYLKITYLFKHLRDIEDIDMIDLNVGDYIGSTKFSEAEIKRMWENYWMGI